MTKDLKYKLKNTSNEIIDLSELNLFAATKAIIMISTNHKNKKSDKKIKFKVATPNIEKILKDIPCYKQIELI